MKKMLRLNPLLLFTWRKIAQKKRRIILTSFTLFFGYIAIIPLIIWQSGGIPPNNIELYHPIFISSKFWAQGLPLLEKLEVLSDQTLVLVYGTSEAFGIESVRWSFGLGIKAVLVLLVLSFFYGVTINLALMHRKILEDIRSHYRGKYIKLVLLLSSMVFLATMATGEGVSVGASCCGVDPTGVPFPVIFGVSYSIAYTISENFSLFFMSSALVMLLSILYLGYSTRNIELGVHNSHRKV